MEDRLRYRAWDKENKKYIYGVENGLQFYSTAGNLRVMTLAEIEESDKYDLEQCTGLRNKDNTLIYEGDIVQVDSMVYYSEPLTLVIGFHNGAFMAGDRHIDNNSIFMEIIGNIHENSELLEK
ncbi:YopX family protein [Ligilactobacillus sp. LYQ135]